MDDIGRCVSRGTALKTLEQSKVFIPQDRVSAYEAALSRVRYEFRRHDPVKPIGDVCGYCGMPILRPASYCWNCGKEINRESEGTSDGLH